MCLTFPARSERRACLVRSLCVARAVSMATLPAKAVVCPEDGPAHLEVEIERFVGAPGFVQLNPDYFARAIGPAHLPQSPCPVSTIDTPISLETQQMFTIITIQPRQAR